MSQRVVTVNDVSIGGDNPLAIIAGPCLAESYDLCVRIGQAMRDRCAKLGLGYIFKASFDKANRSSITSQRGQGMEAGLELLSKVRDALGVPLTTDLHESHQAAPVAEVADLLQIPAFLCRQTDLLIASARTGKPVNVKKGQFLSPAEMELVVAKLATAEPGCEIMLTERGTFFGYHRLINDFVGLVDMMDFGYPVCFDATHSTQEPGGAGSSSGGRPQRAPMLARCAVVAGVDAVFLETHPDPAQAMSDAATMLPLEVALALLDDLARLRD
ncbi:MAG: 3-deoxy-8-phosphooctulonate synthase [Phycisphaeraceae bacterium]|nr:3-deoxy-8-phosphooctulonate synthase [Phycisphaeraceae bacterium]